MNVKTSYGGDSGRGKDGRGMEDWWLETMLIRCVSEKRCSAVA